ncbi:antitoxin VapB29 [Angustibacter peucedani]
MRTTIDLPDDLHRAARAIAHDRHQSLSSVVAEIMRRGLQQEPTDPSPRESSSRHGFPTFEATGHPITADDVRALDDDA